MLSLDELDIAVDKCLKVRKGITSQYFYRSLYAVQLYHCFKYIPRNQFLIIGKVLSYSYCIL